ncbi:hypothetical protein AWM79_07860 [Pseudomonas agarici]|uniref:Glycosyltransferase 2-like domain-containing protein n=2 Tax=Pseudomonas agarici TaxID=46677 RepID=A0A0X1SZH3_PSEAA|nr:glycosyltransferase family 2 protein [Pseudomonas agarici]AMB85222.1 hypothetical protein AWM79_07860 [Pseudomonas agarici]NWC10856.1 glycosyltransferase family 2 protein [Pseudomonas agarici]SEK92162.1 alpha-1,3-rhamnosyltransferase [Pseudomonas agarici]
MKVSVVVPSYNHSEFVCKTIESIFLQDIAKENFELIVVDDCSSDDSVSKIIKLKEKYNFIFIEKETNGGLNHSIDCALKYCSGEYISIIASDDIMLPNKLREQVEYLSDNDFDCVYSKGEIINIKGDVIGQQNLCEFEAELNAGTAYEFSAVDDTSGPLLQSAMLKLKIMREVSSLRKKFKSDDWVVLLYLLKKCKVGFIDRTTFQYRVHEDNTHSKYWDTLPMRLEIPFIFLKEESPKLRRKSISNTLSSHAAALFRDGKYVDAVRFFLASVCFGVPTKKIFRFVLKRVGL